MLHNVYWTCNLLNMFQACLCPSSGARYYTAGMACGVWFLVAGGRKVRCRTAGCASGMRDAVWLLSNSFPHPGCIACCPAPDLPTTSNQESHATCHTSSVVASSWWWAWTCQKHVEQITSSIKYWVASSWFSSSDITTMHGQTHVKFALSLLFHR